MKTHFLRIPSTGTSTGISKPPQPNCHRHEFLSPSERRIAVVIFFAAKIVGWSQEPYSITALTPPSLRIAKPTASNMPILELSAPSAFETEYVIEASTNLIDWTPMSTKMLPYQSQVLQSLLSIQQDHLFYRAKALTTSPISTHTKLGSTASQTNATSFQYTVTGTATETWTNNDRILIRTKKANVGNTQSESLYFPHGYLSFDLILNSTGMGTTSTVTINKINNNNTRALVSKLTCTVSEWEWSVAKTNKYLQIDAFSTYEWLLDVTGSNKLGDGEAIIIGFLPTVHSTTIVGQSFSKNGNITRTNSPKDMGAFTVAFTKPHNGSLSGFLYRVTCSTSDVTVYFADTQGATSISATSHIVAAIVSSTIVRSFALDNGIVRTTEPIVTLNNSATGDPIEYEASESSAFAGSNWQPYSTSPTFKLSPGAGMKTVYFRVRNENDISPSISDTITFDPPPELVYVDARNKNPKPDGSLANPFPALFQGYQTVAVAGTVRVRAGDYSYPSGIFSKALKLEAYDGSVTIHAQ